MGGMAITIIIIIGAAVAGVYETIGIGEQITIVVLALILQVGIYKMKG